MIPLLPILLVIGAGAAIVAIASSASESEPKEDVKPNHAKVLAALQAAKLTDIRNYGADIAPGNIPILDGLTYLSLTNERRKMLLKAFPDASPNFSDKYSSRTIAKQPFAIDEFGRNYEGVPSNVLGQLVTVAAVIAPYIPGGGPIAAATVTTLLALAQGKSAKDAVLAGIRAAIPAHLQPAFDLGVAVVIKGEDPSMGAMLDPYLAPYVDSIPGGREAYEAGKEAIQ